MQKFTLTEQHITLLRNSVVRWEDCEFGAAAIDCKRPYGNSYVHGDMIELLELNQGSVDYDELNRLHAETQIALSIILETGEFRTGTYAIEGYRGWKRVA